MGVLNMAQLRARELGGLGVVDYCTVFKGPFGFLKGCSLTIMMRHTCGAARLQSSHVLQTFHPSNVSNSH